MSDRRSKVYTRNDVEALIAEGRRIIIVDGKVLKVDAWMKYHPGGETSINHMIGRDATDEVTALHSPEAKQQMNSYQIGIIEGRWENFLPPIQGGKFRTRSQLEAIEVSKKSIANKNFHSSSSESSQASSPIFEPSDSAGVRRRHDKTSLTRSSSASSMTSVELESSKASKMGHLDIHTQQEIHLDVSKYPSLDSAIQDEIVRKYRDLNKRIFAEGLYNCPYSSYGIEMCRYSLLFGLFIFFLRLGWFCTSAVFLGLTWHQLVFSAHDAGHMGITHNFHVDSVIGIIIADFIGGLSLGWWKRNHNVHHIVTNSPEHDPDIQHMPFFAISHRFLENLYSSYYKKTMDYDAIAKVLIPYQRYLYYIILCFGRFNLYRLSWMYLFSADQAPRKGPAWWHRWLEIAGQVFFWTWFGYFVVCRSIPTWGSRLLFIVVSHVVTMPLHLQITLSHFAMSTADLGIHESFPQKMLRTTMDVDCPQWLDFIHGGLQFQAIHHLYPRIPRHNLRRTQKLIMEFCDEVGIPYALFGFVDGNKEVLSRLGEVSRQAAILKKCQETVAQSEGFGMH